MYRWMYCNCKEIIFVRENLVDFIWIGGNGEMYWCGCPHPTMVE